MTSHYIFVHFASAFQTMMETPSSIWLTECIHWNIRTLNRSINMEDKNYELHTY